MSAADMLAQDFGLIAEVIRQRAVERPDHPALVDARQQLTFAELDALMDRVAASLQRDGLENGQRIAICAASTVDYAVTFLGGLRAGAVVTPIAPSSTPESLVRQLRDSGAVVFFLDDAVANSLGDLVDQTPVRRVTLDGSGAGLAFKAWLAPQGAKPAPVTIEPTQAFNLIYSSGTTGEPKGIAQSHRQRWIHSRRDAFADVEASLVSTPLYSNTTLVAFFPTLAYGATAIIMEKFDAAEFLRLAQAHKVTHAMLVPVQYRRIMDRPDFDQYDLSSFRMKCSTSAPLSAELKADIVRRWPGGMIEYYGMTEGGCTCALPCHEHPDKLHTVGKPVPGSEMRLIDEDGNEVAQGQIGECVGRSAAMMLGYHNQPQKTAEMIWTSPEGLTFFRTGDVGRFDEDGFLTLMDRKKDMIISGGFNIYPSDLEAELDRHEAVAESAVVGVASRAWGETPVAFVALKAGRTIDPEALKALVNARLGKTQRLADLQIVDALPRSHIGKVLKRDLRDGYSGPAATA